VSWLLPYVASIAGFVLAAALAIVILRERRPPASTLAWLLLIAFAPWLGVPAYLALGGRKLHQRSRGKPGLRLADDAAPAADAAPADPLARVLIGAGAGLPSPGNELRWHASGVEAYAELCRVIDGAVRSIRVATFVLGDDEVGRDLAGRLAARARSGIEVCVLVDGLLARRARHLLADLRAAGARTAVFLPLIKLPLRGRSNLRNHRKAVLVDGELAILGGRNLAGEYLGPTPRPDRWRDLSLTLAGPAVALVDEVFRADWQFAHGPALAGVGPAPPRGEVEVHVVPSGPDVPGDPVYEALLHVVFTAQRRLWIATPYFAPDQALERGLELAVRRGVDVRLVVPRRSNHAVADLVTRGFLASLSRRGVTVLRYGPGMMHAKLVLADDIVITGSANLDQRSLFLDFELCVVTHDPASVDAITALYADLVAGSDPTPARRRLRDDVGRLLAPLV
jgi:cardiolipin synthase A/B